MEQNYVPGTVDLRVSTWIRDTYGLYDYNCKNAIVRNFSFAEDALIVRNQDECSVRLKDSFHDHELTLVATKLHRGKYIVHQEGLLNNEIDSMWLVIRYTSPPAGPKGHLLSEGNLLKIGRVKLRVKHSSLTTPENPVIFDNGKTLQVSEHPEHCRICLDDETTSENPLITPCKCAGSMGFIHTGCLKYWLKSKITSRHTSKASSYYWKDIACELCKQELPSYVSVAGKIIHLFDVTFPDKPFIVLEDYRMDQQESYGIHIISLADRETLMIGRAHECGLKLSDISVSRQHCMIRNINNSFYLEDNESKFGTLVRLKGPVGLLPNSELTIQVSRSLLTFKVKVPWSLGSCCSCSKAKILPEYSPVTMGGEVLDQGPSFRESVNSSPNFIG